MFRNKCGVGERGAGRWLKGSVQSPVGPHTPPEITRGTETGVLYDSGGEKKNQSLNKNL